MTTAWKRAYRRAISKSGLAQFFAENGSTHEAIAPPKVSDDEMRFLTQIRRYSANLNDSDRKLLLAMVKKFASSANASA